MKLWIAKEVVTGGRFFGVFTYNFQPIVGFVFGRFAVYIGWGINNPANREAFIHRGW